VSGVSERLLTNLMLARDGLDRAAERRTDDGWLDTAWRSAAARVVSVHRGKVLVRDEGAEAAVALGEGGAELPVPSVRILLGVDGELVFFAQVLDPAAEPAEPAGAEQWRGLRDFATSVPERDAALAVAAVALANWHGTHPRCPRCGAVTEPSSAGWSRTCPDDASQHFPRSDPAVIVLITDDEDRALLGRRADWPEGRYSTLAGFVEAGESAEMAVRREMLEEAGVAVDRLDYLGSQPWPFPASLMLGYRARIAPGSGPATPDGEEITELRWFTRAELGTACADGSAAVPPPISIARRLIERWYGGDIPGGW
jgi:NAD+ diphosphatase